MTDLEEFMLSLLIAGMEPAQVAEKGYAFALAQQTDSLEKGSVYVSAVMMSVAAFQVRHAMSKVLHMARLAKEE